MRCFRPAAIHGSREETSESHTAHEALAHSFSLTMCHPSSPKTILYIQGLDVNSETMPFGGTQGPSTLFV